MKLPHWAPRRVEVCGIEYPIHYVTAKRMKKEAGVVCWGCVDAKKYRIYLDKELLDNPTLLHDTLVHEAAGHCVWDASGIGHWMQTQIRNKKRFYEFQEVFVRWNTPHVIATIKSIRVLKDSK